MTLLSHTAEIEVGADPEPVWLAVTDPELTRRYYYACAIEGDWRPGGAWSYRTSGGAAVMQGTVLEADRPRLLRLSAADRWDARTKDDPPYRISWEIESLGGGRSRVRLTHDGFETENASYRNSADLEPLLRGLRNLVDPEAAAAIRRLDAVGEVQVHALTPERLDDLLAFFDGPAFADNPSWGFCYCYNWRFGGSEAEAAERVPADNRRDMAGDVAAGRAHGLLAYADGRVVGWCSASLRGELPRLERADWMPQGGRDVGMIGCLVVAAPYRRHGISRRLVAASLDYLAGLGCTVAEAYPLRELHEAVHGHWGALEIYRELGFETERELPRRLVVRRPLP